MVPAECPGSGDLTVGDCDGGADLVFFLALTQVGDLRRSYNLQYPDIRSD